MKLQNMPPIQRGIIPSLSESCHRHPLTFWKLVQTFSRCVSCDIDSLPLAKPATVVSKIELLFAMVDVCIPPLCNGCTGVGVGPAPVYEIQCIGVIGQAELPILNDCGMICCFLSPCLGAINDGNVAEAILSQRSTLSTCEDSNCRAVLLEGDIEREV